MRTLVRSAGCMCTNGRSQHSSTDAVRMCRLNVQQPWCNRKALYLLVSQNEMKVRTYSQASVCTGGRRPCWSRGRAATRSAPQRRPASPGLQAQKDHSNARAGCRISSDIGTISRQDGLRCKKSCTTYRSSCANSSAVSESLTGGLHEARRNAQLAVGTCHCQRGDVPVRVGCSRLLLPGTPHLALLPLCIFLTSCIGMEQHDGARSGGHACRRVHAVRTSSRARSRRSCRCSPRPLAAAGAMTGCGRSSTAARSSHISGMVTFVTTLHDTSYRAVVKLK